MIGIGVAAKSLHGARVCVIPRPENNFKPLALRRGPLLFVAALLIAAKALAIGATALTPLPAELSTITNARIVQLTNVERANAGLGDLKVNAKLSEAAAQKAADMLDSDYFAHISPTGVTPWFWMNKIGYTYQVAGENLAIDFVEAEDVVKAWMASPTHRDNIVHKSYVETGVAVLTGEYQGGTSTVVVHMFGLPSNEVDPSPLSASTLGSAIPTPSPSPSPPPIVVTAPIPPVLTIGSTETVFSDNISINVTSEKESVVTILANKTEISTIAFKDVETQQGLVSLSNLADGSIELSAYAVSNSSGLQSELSSPISFTKDTTGPDIDRTDMVVLVGPAFDQPRVALELPTSGYSSISIGNLESIRLEEIKESTWVATDIDDIPLLVTLYDDLDNAGQGIHLELLPSIYTEREIGYLAPPRNFAKTVRSVALYTIIIIGLLLALAVIVRFRIQHPKMIAHASIVLLLAAAMFVL